MKKEQLTVTINYGYNQTSYRDNTGEKGGGEGEFTYNISLTFGSNLKRKTNLELTLLKIVDFNLISKPMHKHLPL